MYIIKLALAQACRIAPFRFILKLMVKPNAPLSEKRSIFRKIQNLMRAIPGFAHAGNSQFVHRGKLVQAIGNLDATRISAFSCRGGDTLPLSQRRR
jgi:hypothetical protein